MIWWVGPLCVSMENQATDIDFVKRLQSRSSLGLIGTLWPSVLPWHSGDIHRWHHKLGYRVCQCALVHVLDERAGRCRKVSHCSDMRRETGRKWAPRSCILFYCQRAQQSLVVVYYHTLPTHEYASWLSCHCWTQDLQQQHCCLEENTISIQITDCWAASWARERGKKSTTKSIFYRWIGRVCRRRCSSRNH